MPNKRKSLKEVLNGGGLKSFIDPRLIKALGHPIREHALAVFNERIASATEIGEEIGLDVPAFYSHVATLEEMGCIELVETRRRRGAKEHFFQAKATMIFDDRAWLQLPASLKSDICVEFLQSILNDLVRAVKAGTFAGRGNKHVSWTPGLFDVRGWREVLALIDETLSRLMAIQHESARRMARTGEPGFPVTVALLGFETGSAFARGVR
jgi:DNA-binding transcriptional ArsR family regulator